MRHFGIHKSAYPQLRSARLRITPTSVLCLLLLAVVFYTQQRQYNNHSPYNGEYSSHSRIPRYKPPVSKLAKVSMLYGKPQACYQKAVASQERHAALHGNPVHILRNDMQEGYWNKPAYILSIVLRELEKDPGDRIEWLMWFDADSVIVNPEISAETFLPPQADHDLYPEHIHLLVTKDFNGLNTGIFFIRVHEWSVRFLSKTLAVPLFRPDVDLGPSADQQAMAYLINETDFRPNTTFIPKQWVNSYLDDFQRGDMILHFPGLYEREYHLKYWVNQVEASNARSEWRMPDHRVPHVKQARDFWKRVKSCRKVSSILAHRFNDDIEEENGGIPLELRDAISFFRETCWYMSDDEVAIANATRRVDDAMKLLSAGVGE